jgi:non-canonical poly(A) RNA polymerase PAPD5/7
MDRLSIIDPNNSANDIAGGSSNFSVIQHCFAKAYRTLQNSMMQLARGPTTTPPDWTNWKMRTLLNPLFAGNYEPFRLQRNWLLKLHIEGIENNGRTDRTKRKEPRPNREDEPGYW